MLDEVVVEEVVGRDGEREVAFGAEDEIGDKDVDVAPCEYAERDAAALRMLVVMVSSRLTWEATRSVAWKKRIVNLDFHLYCFVAYM